MPPLPHLLQPLDSRARIASAPTSNLGDYTYRVLHVHRFRSVRSSARFFEWRYESATLDGSPWSGCVVGNGV